MIRVAMWGKALRVIPRVTKEEWDELDIVSRWLVATRSAVFIMTAVSCGIGGLLAYRDGAFSWASFGLCMLGLVFAHATNNLLNDLTDHLKGIDKDNYFRAQYGPQPLEHGLMSIRQLLVYIAVTGAVAASAGVALILMTGWTTAVLMAAGALFVLFYTWPLKYIGLGEPSVILVWGPLMIGGTYYVVSGGHWDWNIAVISLAYAIGPTTVLFGKHTDKLEQDREKGVHTLPVLLGEETARFAVIALWSLQFVLTGVLVSLGALGLALVVVLGALPKLVWAAQIYAKPRPTSEPEGLPPNVWPLYLSAVSFVYNRLFGLLFLLGLIIDVLVKKV
jgi:1,4-dihydroxy-2-naphthoate octaprenyltransferase